jgi:DNA-binding CsgD family transcriptional regulator/PAS domain-containing protein
MPDMSQSGVAAARHTRWVAMWREAVRASSLRIGLSDLSTHRFVELSRTAAGLLGTTPEEGPGLNYLTIAERPQAAEETFRLLRERVLDGIRARRRYRQPDGSMVEIESSWWAIRSHTGPDLGLWVASELPSEVDDRTSAAEEAVTASPSAHGRPKVVGARVTLDNHWRMARVSTGAGLLLGRFPGELLRHSIVDLAHRDDVAPLLFAFARATTEPGASARVRLRHQDGNWSTTEVSPTVLEGDGTMPFALEISMDVENEVPGSSGRAATLAGDLRRIAAEIEAVGPPVQNTGPADLEGTEHLTPRQWEVASRLVRGEHVATIASEMYLSQSTVRNHLSAIFRKLGVHSQQEFLSLWLGGARGPSA